MRALRLTLTVIWYGLIWVPATPVLSISADHTTIAVIVAKSAPYRPLDQDALARVFLRQQILWENRDPILPINLEASNPLRRLFSKRVLKLDPEDLDGYWNDQYFHGIFPPYVLASEEAVLRFVAASPHAIGYVSACMVDQRVRTLAYLTADGLRVDGDPARFCLQH